MRENEADKRYTVVVTGWMEDETFEDNVTVHATNADEAAAAGVEKIEAYWGSKVEVGDVNVYEGMS